MAIPVSSENVWIFRLHILPNGVNHALNSDGQRGRDKAENGTYTSQCHEFRRYL